MDAFFWTFFVVLFLFWTIFGLFGTIFVVISPVFGLEEPETDLVTGHTYKQTHYTNKRSEATVTVQRSVPEKQRRQPVALSGTSTHQWGEVLGTSPKPKRPVATHGTHIIDNPELRFENQGPG